jgi:hypothetical protein
MTAHVGSRAIVRSAFVLAVCLGWSSHAAAQQSAEVAQQVRLKPDPTDRERKPDPTGADAQDPHTSQSTQPDQTGRTGQPEYPSLHLSGFADVDFAAQDTSEGPRGFSEGQFVLHLASALSPRVNFFGEISLTPRADAGTGSPAAPGFNAEVERVIIRFDHSDRLKVSFGRYHTPINWWNTAFHHGQWLQTTVSRPEMVQFGGKFLPVHFVGALAEGALRADGWNLNYQAGIGNGRGNVISRGGDAGDNNAHPAVVLNLFVKPDRVFPLQVGGSVYFDRVSAAGRPEFDERITAAHAVWQREDPELVAEIADVRHEMVGGAQTTANLAYYIQAAYRLPSSAHLWKPYFRFEHVEIDAADPVFVGVPDLDGSTLGVRFDISTYAAIKSEIRVRRRVADQARKNGWFVQISFTF